MNAPLVLAVIVVALAAGIFLMQWYYAQIKYSEMYARWAQKIAEYKTLCLSAITDGQQVIVGSHRGQNFSAPNCYVDPNVIIIVDINATEWRR